HGVPTTVVRKSTMVTRDSLYRTGCGLPAARDGRTIVHVAGGLMERWWLDLRYAVRVLLRKPGFTIVAVLSLALGIGANTAIFTVINAIFLHPLAVDEPSRLVELFTKDNKTVQTGNFTLTPSSYQNYEDYRDQQQVFTGLAAYNNFGLQWTHDGETEGLPGMMASGNYFEVLGIKAFRGRVFGPGDDDRPGANTVAVISHTLSTKRYVADPNRS